MSEELVSRAYLLAEYDRQHKGKPGKAREIIATAPAVDAEPVVHCKDCKHMKKATANDKGFLICPASGMEITDNDFCSYGEYEEGNR